jgi:hypothetical protein
VSLKEAPPTNPGGARQIGLIMTTVTRSFRHPRPAEVDTTPREFDVRCSATMPEHRPNEGRCQLFAGHDGPHAVMFARDGARLVRTWRGKSGKPKETDLLHMPWMFGFPVPAWSETKAPSTLTS